jgi:hypothetical protein
MPLPQSHTEPYRCPRCQAFSLSRLHRTPVDRLVSLVHPVKRFECERCGWVGRIRADRREALPSASSEAWVWCRQCARCYREDAPRMVGGTLSCAYHDCSGSFANTWQWRVVRRRVPSYPEVPSMGVRYPLLGIDD